MKILPPPGLRLPRYCRSSAFTLIEITLALATIAFVMTAITGLLSQMAKIARDSSDQTLITTMTGTVAADLRGRPFDEIPCDISVSSPPSVRYFYEDGTECQASTDSAAFAMRALYKCEITGTADLETMAAPGSASLITVHLKFTWPLEAAKPNSSIFHFDLARY